MNDAYLGFAKGWKKIIEVRERSDIPLPSSYYICGVLTESSFFCLDLRNIDASEDDKKEVE